MPKIGYGSNKATKFLMPDGYRKVTINNVSELQVLLMQSQKIAAEIAHNVSARNRLIIVQKARELNIKLTNPHSRLLVAESN